MKRGIQFALLVACLSFVLFPETTQASRYYSRNYFRSYYDNYYYRSPTFGISSPYERTRRPLNAPVSRSSRYRSPQVVYMVPQPMPMMPMMSPVMGSSIYPSSFPYYTSPYSSLYSPIQMIGPSQPTIIERVIVERRPVEPSPDPPAQVSAPAVAYIPSQPVGDDGGFVQKLDRAQRLFRERNYQEAVTAFHEASGLNSENAVVKMGQAMALLAVGDYEGSASALRRALLLNPEWNEQPILLATFYGVTNDFYAHLARLERFVRKSEENVDARFLLSYLYVVVDRSDEAAEILAKILETHPNDLDATTLLGRIASAKQGN